MEDFKSQDSERRTSRDPEHDLDGLIDVPGDPDIQLHTASFKVNL